MDPAKRKRIEAAGWKVGTVEELLERLGSEMKPGGVYLNTVSHNDGCPTIESQKMEDCTCEGDVDQEVIDLTEDLK